MPVLHKYVPINGRYYCLEQNAAALGWFLYFNDRSLQLHSGSTRGWGMSTVKALLKHQLRLRDSTPILELPAHGNLCLPVHRGYKIFDFRRKTVTKIIASEVDPATLLNEIQAVRKASSLDFSPNILGWSVKERWYKEDFVNGYPCYSNAKSDSPGFSEIYQRDIVPCLQQMILLQDPVTTNLQVYLEKTVGILEDRRLSSAELDGRKINSIESFVESMVERLRPWSNSRVDLVFSHGDFSLVNILRTKDRIMVIDWEGAARRSILFDLYNYFFTELYYNRAKTSLVPEITEAISTLQSHLVSKVPNLARILVSSAYMYRRLYYLERIRMLLERDLSNKQLDVVLRSIEVFSSHENTEASPNLS